MEFDKKWLEGMKFNDVKKNEAEKNGRKVIQNTAWPRPATVKDVMNFREDGENVVVVLKDGTKHPVKK